MKTKNSKKPAGKPRLIETEATAKPLDRRDLEETGFREMSKGTHNAQVLDARFFPAIFDELYIKPLTDAGMSVEAALDLLLDGALMPN